jgi:hypothetical protein
MKGVTSLFSVSPGGDLRLPEADCLTKTAGGVASAAPVKSASSAFRGTQSARSRPAAPVTGGLLPRTMDHVLQSSPLEERARLR